MELESEALAIDSIVICENYNNTRIRNWIGKITCYWTSRKYYLIMIKALFIKNNKYYLEISDINNIY